MERLFERHDAYLSIASMEYVRNIMHRINWNSRLIVIRGPKGVGKSTLMKQYIKSHFEAGDRHVLYCSADANYFATHSLVEVADKFVKIGGQWLFIDEVHKYPGWSQEIKDIYDLYGNLHIVLSGSSITFDQLLENASKFCAGVCAQCHPLEHFSRYLQYGYYPFYFEGKQEYYDKLENVVNYIVDVELTKYRSVEVGNTRKVKALLQVLSQMTPYEVDIAKLSKATGIMRTTVLKYLTYLEEARLIRRLFTDLQRVTDLQKPDKIYLDNSNLLYALCLQRPEIGTVREAFFANQLASAGHTVEYAGYKKGDFRIDGNTVIEVGGADKGFSQLEGQEHSFVAADDIESASMRKIPLWAFGFLY